MASTCFETLADDMKDADKRSTLQCIYFDECAKVINRITSLSETTFYSKDNLIECKSIFRFLRNSCIACDKNQLHILSSNALQASLVLIEMLCQPTSYYAVTGPLLEEIRELSVQYLGNLTVNNSTTQHALWIMAFPKLFYKLLTSLNDKGKDTVCMVILNCLKSREDVFQNENAALLMLPVLDLCRDHQQSDWSLLLVEHVIASNWIPSLYQKLQGYTAQRQTLLDLLDAYLDAPSCPIDVPSDSLVFLADEWSHVVDAITTKSTNSHSDNQECSTQMQGLLKVLCTCSAQPLKYGKVATSSLAVDTAVKMLRYLQSNALDDAVGPSSLDQDPLASQENSKFETTTKSDLVRLLGNLCYRQKIAQDKVRQLEGIPLILECCTLDERRPYITQWAVFAIRNLCEGNLENQETIKMLEAYDIIQDDHLTRQGLHIRMNNGRLKVVREEK